MHAVEPKSDRASAVADFSFKAFTRLASRVLTTGGLFRTAMALRLEPALIQRTGNRLDVIAAYAVGTVAAFWLIERSTAFCVGPQRLLRRPQKYGLRLPVLADFVL